jgi:hypothetical protein
MMAGMTTRTVGGLYIAVAAAAALAVLTGGPASLAASQGQDAGAGQVVSGLTTKALFAEVHRAYLHVPAVELSAIPRESTLKFPRRFVLILHKGRVMAEEFTRSGRDGTTLVARTFRQTYARPAGSKCWRRLPSSDPQTLKDVDVPFPYTRTALGIGDKALPPKKTAFGWVVATDTRVEFWFLALQRHRPAHLLDQRHLPIKRFITYAIDGKSHRLRSLFIQTPNSRRKQKKWLSATLKVTALTKAPRLPTPSSCDNAALWAGVPMVLSAIVGR